MQRLKAERDPGGCNWSSGDSRGPSHTRIAEMLSTKAQNKKDLWSNSNQRVVSVER